VDQANSVDKIRNFATQVIPLFFLYTYHQLNGPSTRAHDRIR